MELIQNFKNLANSDRYIEELKEIVLTKLFQQDAEDFFTIVPGVKGGQQVASMKGFEYITKASEGCGGSGISPTFPAFSQKWNPKLAEVKIEICYSDFLSTFIQWGLKNGYQIKDLTGTELGVFIQELVGDAMKRDLLRNALLSDKDIASQDILTDEVGKAPFYNIIDKGLLPTLAYLKTLPEFADAFYTLDKNTGTVAQQMALTPEYAVNTYEKLILDNYEFEADILLTSNKLFKNYEAFLRRANGYGVQGNIDATVNGVNGGRIDGKDIVKPVVAYDGWKKKDFTISDGAGGLTVHQPHFALLTRKEFLQIGVDDVASLQNIVLEYIGGAEETFWIKANYLFDFKMVNPYALKASL